MPGAMLRGRLNSGSAAVTHHRLRPAKIDEASCGQIQGLSVPSNAHGINTLTVDMIESNRFSQCEN